MDLLCSKVKIISSFTRIEDGEEEAKEATSRYQLFTPSKGDSVSGWVSSNLPANPFWKGPGEGLALGVDESDEDSFAWTTCDGR
tara:strand:+ start:223 stop:474 length:252 start_codon:yes stop_codon:yes gene_type:complete